jgi:hypothetical protein
LQEHGRSSDGRGDAQVPPSADFLEEILLRAVAQLRFYRVRAAAFLPFDADGSRGAGPVGSEGREAILAAFREAFPQERSSAPADGWTGELLGGETVIAAGSLVGAWNEAGRAFASALEESCGIEDVARAMGAVELLRVEVVEEGREDEAARMLPIRAP